MKEEKDRRRYTTKESLFILTVAFLFLVTVTAVGVSQFPVGRELMVSQHVTAASYDGPRIVGGVVPGGIVRTEEKSGEDKGNEPIFLSWEFINGLFTNYRLQGSSEFVFEVSRRRRGPQYQRSTGDNPLQEIFAF